MKCKNCNKTLTDEDRVEGYLTIYQHCGEYYFA